MVAGVSRGLVLLVVGVIIASAWLVQPVGLIYGPPGLQTGFFGGFAGPTDRYIRFLSQMPSGMVPEGPGSAAVVGAFEEEGAVLWEAFFLALFLTSSCLVGILRMRWLETERLGFPMLVLPLGLLGVDGLRLYRSRASWWGVAVPAVGEMETRLNLGDFCWGCPGVRWRHSPLRFCLSSTPLWWAPPT